MSRDHLSDYISFLQIADAIPFVSSVKCHENNDIQRQYLKWPKYFICKVYSALHIQKTTSTWIYIRLCLKVHKALYIQLPMIENDIDQLGELEVSSIQTWKCNDRVKVRNGGWK